MNRALLVTLLVAFAALAWVAWTPRRELLSDGKASVNGLWRGARSNVAQCVEDDGAGCPFFVRNERGHFLHVRWFPASAKAGAVVPLVVVVHGWAEHLGRKRNVIDELRNAYDVVAFDHQGHGFSAGVPNFDVAELFADTAAVISTVQEEAGARPTFIYGHSMGGLVALGTAIKFAHLVRVDGVVVSGPLLASEKATPFLRAVSDIVETLLPHLPIVAPLDADISNDPAVVADYVRDPLVYRGGIPARMGASCMRGIDFVQKEAASLKMPVLVIHGDADRVCALSGSQQFVASNANAKLHIVPGGWHELMHEKENRAIILDWLAAQTKNHV